MANSNRSLRFVTNALLMGFAVHLIALFALGVGASADEPVLDGLFGLERMGAWFDASTRSLPDGVYLAVLRAGDEQISQKVLVSR